MSDIIPVSWGFADYKGDGPSITIDLMRSPFYEGTRYAVRQGGSCLSIDGEWDYEPMPSSRTDEFYARFRFMSFTAAVDAARKARKP